MARIPMRRFREDSRRYARLLALGSFCHVLVRTGIEKVVAAGWDATRRDTCGRVPAGLAAKLLASSKLIIEK